MSCRVPAKAKPPGVRGAGPRESLPGKTPCPPPDTAHPAGAAGAVPGGPEAPRGQQPSRVPPAPGRPTGPPRAAPGTPAPQAAAPSPEGRRGCAPAALTPASPCQPAPGPAPTESPGTHSPDPAGPPPALTGGPGRGGAAAPGAGGDRGRSCPSDEKPAARAAPPRTSRPAQPMAKQRFRCPARVGPWQPISAAAPRLVTAAAARGGCPWRLFPDGTASRREAALGRGRCETARREGRQVPGTAVRETQLSSGQRRDVSARPAAAATVS